MNEKGIAAVFLDRDGTINEEFHYTSDPKDLRLIEGVAGAISRLNERSIPVIIISNQSGVARGFHTEAQIEIFHRAISKELKKAGAHIDGFYYCPHHPEGSGKHAIECDCRKPKPGLLLRAAKEKKLDLSRCVMIGDAARDIEAGIAAGCEKTILVMTGKGVEQWSTWHESFKPTHVAKDLRDAVNWLFGPKG